MPSSYGRIVVLGVSLATLLCSLFLSEYHLKVQVNQYTREEINPDPKCTPDSVSATTYEELRIPVGANVTDAVHSVQRHGVSFFEDLLTAEQAKALRDYILKEAKNHKRDSWFVINSENRDHLTFGLDEDPIIYESVRTIVTQQPLRGTLEALFGGNAALMELASIVSYPGAEEQHWHMDTYKTTRDVDLYSLFIPLQRTTPDMGATALCAGTQDCKGFRYDDDRHCDGYDKTLYAASEAGTGALMKSTLYHRGSAHTGNTNEARVMFYMSWAAPPKADSSGLPPSGATYALQDNQWGRTLQQIIDRSYSMLSPIDFWSPNRGWNYVEMTWIGVAEEESDSKKDHTEWILERAGWLWTVAVALLVLYTLIAEIDLYMLTPTTTTGKQQQQPQNDSNCKAKVA